MSNFTTIGDLANVSVVSARELLSTLSDLEADYEIFEEDFNGSSPYHYDTVEVYVEEHMGSAEFEFLEALRDVADDLESCRNLDDMLIKEDHFVEYVKQLITDNFGDLKQIQQKGSWPYNHVSIDFDNAAEEAELDYREIEIGPYTFLILA
jgi:hypothetical protein